MALPLNPNINDTYVIGSKTYRWNGNAWTRSNLAEVESVLLPYALDTDLTTSNVVETANLYFTNARVLSYLQNIGGNLLPAADIQYSLGSLTRRWKELYISGNTIILGNTKIESSGDGSLVIKSTNTEVTSTLSFSSNGYIASEAGAITTSNVAEGANLYFTNTRAISSLTAGANISIAANGMVTALTQGGGASAASVSDQINPSTGYFDLPSGNTAQRPLSPPSGAVRFNTTTGYGEVYNSSLAQWFSFGTPPTLSVEYLVIAGGGGGGGGYGGGGGAGGYRVGTLDSVLIGSPYTATVGGGGTGSSGVSGSDSVFSTITSTGGGGGGSSFGSISGKNGGSGGGGRPNAGLGNTPSTTPSQGNDGAVGASSTAGGGGGGAGSAGSGKNGGSGSVSSITGTNVTRAGGGGAFSGGVGGSGGGGNPGVAGSPNTGGGGGADTDFSSGNGGSGIVILRIPSAYTATVSAGLSVTTDTSSVPGYRIFSLTAGTGTVTFSIA